jgi:ribosomal protein L23
VCRNGVDRESRLLSADLNTSTFRVSSRAEKRSMALAVEEVFKVKVESVNVLKMSGKSGCAREKLGRARRIINGLGPSAQSEACRRLGFAKAPQ